MAFPIPGYYKIDKKVLGAPDTLSIDEPTFVRVYFIGPSADGLVGFYKLENNTTVQQTIDENAFLDDILTPENLLLAYIDKKVQDVFKLLDIDLVDQTQEQIDLIKLMLQSNSLYIRKGV